MQNPKYFLIDSRDRISGNSSNFQIQIQPGIKDVKRVKLCGLSLPLTNYIIDSSNQNIYFKSDSSFTAVLSPGIYDYVTLCDEIKRAMEATGYTGTITAYYSPVTLKFIITGTVAFMFEWGTYTTNSASYILGFNNGDTALGLTQYSTNVPQLSIPPYFYINIDAFPSLCRSSKGDNATFVIFSQYNSGFLNFHFDKTHYSLEIDGSIAPIQYFNVNLKSRGDYPMNLNNCDWQMLLEFCY